MLVCLGWTCWSARKAKCPAVISLQIKIFNCLFAIIKHFLKNAIFCCISVDSAKRAKLLVKDPPEDSLAHLKGEGGKPTAETETPAENFMDSTEVRPAGAKGKGLFARKELPICEIKDVVDGRFKQKIGGNTNDAVLPDWQRMLCDSQGDIAQALKVWEEYVSESRAKANMRFLPTMDAVRLVDACNLQEASKIFMGARFDLEICKPVGVDEELFRHYGLQWLSMKYYSLCFLIDHWQCHISWI